MCYEFTVNFQILKTISCILLLLQDFAYPFHRIVLSFAKNVYLCRIKSKVCGMSHLVNHNCPQSHCKCPKNLRPPRHVHLKLLYLKAWRNKSNAGNLFGYKFLTGVKLSFGLFVTLALAYAALVDHIPLSFGYVRAARAAVFIVTAGFVVYFTKVLPDEDVLARFAMLAERGIRHRADFFHFIMLNWIEIMLYAIVLVAVVKTFFL